MEAGKPLVVHPAAGEALTRRQFVAISSASIVALRQSSPVTIGVQSYSFRDRSVDDAIAAMRSIGLRSCELWEGHVKPQSLDTCRRVRDQFAAARIALSAFCINITDDFSDAQIEHAFDMTSALGAPLITSSSNINTVRRIAPVAARRKMLVGLHNHSELNTNTFATAASLSDALQQGRYIAVNLDVGHFTAANQDSLAFLNRHHDRVVTMHIKDRRRNQGPHVPMGTGDAPIVQVLRLVRDNGWPIPLNLEYEYDGGDAVGEVRKMLDYCRRALDL